jgi:hypothetical protein
MKEEIRIGKIIIKDFWLWGQIRIEEENCPKCKSSEMITFQKGEQVKELIKVLKKLNKIKAREYLEMLEK